MRDDDDDDDDAKVVFIWPWRFWLLRGSRGSTRRKHRRRLQTEEWISRVRWYAERNRLRRPRATSTAMLGAAVLAAFVAVLVALVFAITMH